MGSYIRSLGIKDVKIKLNLFINLDGQLVSADQITDTHKYDDWYYMSESVELIDDRGKILLDKNNEVDIVPFFREFLLTIHQYKQIFDLYLDDWQTREKLCSQTELYYPHTPKMVFSHMNDVYMELTPISMDDGFHNVDMVEYISVFYKELTRVSERFVRTLELLCTDDIDGLNDFFPARIWLDDIMKNVN